MGTFSFPKIARVRRPAEFKVALDAGRKAVTRHMLVFAYPRVETATEPGTAKAAPSTARLGLVVSRKVGNSVVRNRVKRSLRESFRNFEPELRSTLSHLDLVVIARMEAAQASAAEIDATFKYALGRLSNAHKSDKPR